MATGAACREEQRGARGYQVEAQTKSREMSVVAMIRRLLFSEGNACISA